MMKKRFIKNEDGLIEQDFDIHHKFIPHDSNMHNFVIKKGKDKKILDIETWIITEENDLKVLLMSLPGIDKSTLSVKAKSRNIRITADYLPDASKLFGRQKYESKIQIPMKIDPSKIEASYKYGILKLIFQDTKDPAVNIAVDSLEE